MGIFVFWSNCHRNLCRRNQLMINLLFKKSEKVSFKFELQLKMSYRRCPATNSNIHNHVVDNVYHRKLLSAMIPHFTLHNDVIKWKHFLSYWPFVRITHRWISRHKGQWRRALTFSFICARINGLVNNREDGDLRRYRAYYDVIVMEKERHQV